MKHCCKPVIAEMTKEKAQKQNRWEKQLEEWGEKRIQMTTHFMCKKTENKRGSLLYRSFQTRGRSRTNSQFAALFLATIVAWVRFVSCFCIRKWTGLIILSVPVKTQSPCRERLALAMLQPISTSTSSCSPHLYIPRSAGGWSPLAKAAGRVGQNMTVFGDTIPSLWLIKVFQIYLYRRVLYLSDEVRLFFPCFRPVLLAHKPWFLMRFRLIVWRLVKSVTLKIFFHSYRGKYFVNVIGR